MPNVLKERTVVTQAAVAVAAVAAAAAAATIGWNALARMTSILSDLIVGVVASGQLAVRTPIRIGFGVQLGIAHPAIILY